MFEKLKKILSSGSREIEPRQGKRLSRETDASGDHVFTIKGTRYPGFFIFFGSAFLGIPSLFLWSLLFGDPGDGESSGERIFAYLFLTPFFLIGLTTFLLGLFLAYGRTRITLRDSTIALERSLFGQVFHRKQQARDGVDIQFKTSHEENDDPRYKLALVTEEKTLSFGGSLRQEELLWLERELNEALGKAPVESIDIASRIRQEQKDEIEGTAIDPDFTSKRLRFSKTMHGWEARFHYSFGSAIASIIFGGIFLLIGLLLEGSLLAFLREQFTFIDDLAKSSKSAGSPPPWFATAFALMGALVMLLGSATLGYRMSLSTKHSRIHLSKKWFGIGVTKVFEINQIQDIDISHYGNVNEEARYILVITFKTGEKTKLLRFGEGKDVGQLKARLTAELPPS